MAAMNLNPASQSWGRAVDTSIAGVDTALYGAQQAASMADVGLQVSITRSAAIVEETAVISAYLFTLAVVKSESRTNAIGV